MNAPRCAPSTTALARHAARCNTTAHAAGSKSPGYRLLLADLDPHALEELRRLVAADEREDVVFADAVGLLRLGWVALRLFYRLNAIQVILPPDLGDV